MSKYNCPNCNAPIEGVKCAYCGTYFWNIADIDTKKPTYIRVPLGGNQCMFNVLATNISLEDLSEHVSFYADATLYDLHVNPDYRLTIEMRVVPDDMGIYAIKKMGEANEW